MAETILTLDPLSRLKGIETLVMPVLRPVCSTLDPLSRLKGIETRKFQAIYQHQRQSSLDPLSRLKGIETNSTHTSPIDIFKLWIRFPV